MIGYRPAAQAEGLVLEVRQRGADWLRRRRGWLILTVLVALAGGLMALASFAALDPLLDALPPGSLDWTMQLVVFGALPWLAVDCMLARTPARSWLAVVDPAELGRFLVADRLRTSFAVFGMSYLWLITNGGFSTLLMFRGSIGIGEIYAISGILIAELCWPVLAAFGLVTVSLLGLRPALTVLLACGTAWALAEGLNGAANAVGFGLYLFWEAKPAVVLQWSPAIEIASVAALCALLLWLMARIRRKALRNLPGLLPETGGSPSQLQTLAGNRLR